MIAFLRGTVAALHEESVVLEVSGVGFRVLISTRDAQALGPVGREVKLHTYLSVREDAMQLFGFLSEDDLTVFRQLLGVSGIGPKAALGILSSLTANELRFAVFSDDEKAITRAPGIGSKTAKKLILEMKDRLKLEDALPQAGSTDAPVPGAADTAAAAATAEQTGEAVQALMSLGYTNSEALRAVRQVNVTEDMDASQILKMALRYIGL